MITLIAVTTMLALAPSATSAAGTGSIEGEIVGPGANPLADVWACAYQVQSEEFEENCDSTGNDGIYSIPGLTAGEYKVEFWSESTEPSYVGEFYNDERFWEEADEVEVEEGTASTGIDAELAEAATIEGQVDALSSGEPVEYALVCAQLPSGEPAGCAQDRLNGSYTLSGLAPGKYKVQFIPAGNLYNLLNQFYDHKDTPAEADPLSLTAGEIKTEVDADLKEGAEIHGTIYSSATGLPVPGVNACALFWEEVLGTWLPAGCMPSSSTGSYTLFGLWSDSYKVVFSPDFEELFGEEEDDGYFTRYFDEEPTLAEADLLPLLASEVLTGINGHIQPERPAMLPPTSTSIAPSPTATFVALQPHHKRARHCRAGFVKKKVSGKRRCVKRHKHRHKHSHHGHRGNRRLRLG